MKHIKAITFISNPIVNSYKRLHSGFEAPNYIAWSPKTRIPLIRIPTGRGEGTRIELRNPDATANPYLLLSVCLAAGLEGIRSKEMPPEAVNTNIYEMSRKQRRELGIEKLPGSLLEAAREFEKDSFIREVLGEDLSSKLLEAKKTEYQEYRTQVTEWELSQYLYKI